MDHEKSVVAVSKDLQVPSVCLASSEIHKSKAVHSNVALRQLQRKTFARACRPGSDQGPNGFRALPSSAKSTAGSWCAPALHVFASRHCTANRISNWQ